MQLQRYKEIDGYLDGNSLKRLEEVLRGFKGRVHTVSRQVRAASEAITRRFKGHQYAEGRGDKNFGLDPRMGNFCLPERLCSFFLRGQYLCRAGRAVICPLLAAYIYFAYDVGP